MIYKKIFSVLIILLIISSVNTLIYSQDTIQKEVVKKGISFGGIPALAYNTDNGLLYGAIGDIFYYGDGSSYPNYKYKSRLILDWTTKGNQEIVVFTDFREILPYNLRLLVDIETLRHKMLPFFGFNGYDANYNANYIDQGSAQYISRAYYSVQRSWNFITVDLQGNAFSSKIRWLTALGYMNFNIKTVDIDNINEGLDDKDKLPDTLSLFEKYVNEGAILQDEKTGGNVAYYKAGLIYDTRDNESNPSKGLWAEAVFIGAPGWMGNNWQFGQLGLIMRHYHTLVPGFLTFANRIGYQSLLYGKKPFFMLPILFTSFKTRDAFGGVKTIRGIILDRIQGNSVLYGNVEMRYKFLKFKWLNQNLYLANNTFFDWGIVTEKYQVNIPTTQLEALEIDKSKEKLHVGIGTGLKVALNQNFVVSFEFAKAVNKNDGNTSIYVDLDFLF